MKYIDCEIRDNKYFIVCEYIKGYELISLLEQYGPMTESKAKKIF
jgi:calcium-dependent protein kinase